ncbi:PCRF domain-containing protein, partial [Patescibacteria group bacterium]|nr:PCRF domain-containing protein [Patescibacteria group bacterium]
METKDELRNRLDRLREKLRPDRLNGEIVRLENEMGESSFWEDRAKATKGSKLLAHLKKQIETLDLFELYWEDGELKELEKELEKFEILIFFSHKYDSSLALLSIHSGQGGVEAMDWALMLQRMYMQYFEKQGWSFRRVEEVRG